jgi:hypothetical protein
MEVLCATPCNKTSNLVCWNLQQNIIIQHHGGLMCCSLQLNIKVVVVIMVVIVCCSLQQDILVLIVIIAVAICLLSCAKDVYM